MPMKLLKRENEEQIVIERAMHARRDRLTLEKRWCVGCGLCVITCPREAISLREITKDKEGNVQKPQIDIDEEKCHYCGICNTICIFGALTLSLDGEVKIPVAEAESFPELTKEVKVDPSKCDLECIDCEEVCPFDLIRVEVRDWKGNKIEDVEAVEDKEGLTFNIEVDKAHCPCCRICAEKCPPGVMNVKKIFHGRIKINQEKCPEGCDDCLDVCPIPGVLYKGEDGKVYVDDTFCVYCGTCKLVCPVEEALELQRAYISHAPVKSGAWNKALEKLTSTRGMAKELYSKGLFKLKESVERRMKWRVKAGV